MVKKIFKKINNNFQVGVTLIELMVIVAIVGVVSSVLLFNYSDFSTNVSIRNLSQEIALSIRKSQTYATSVSGVTSSGERSYPAYGLIFSLESSSLPFMPTPKKFISFADIPLGLDSEPNEKYDSDGYVCGNVSSGSECVESISINSADSIVGLETDVTGPVTSGSIAVTFRRPSPDAIICYIPSGSTDCIPQTSSYAKITLKSVKGLTRSVSVWNTGQITAQ